jgi:hypothetical protein
MTAFEGDSVLIGCDLCQTEVTFPAHGQFTAKDDRPPNNPARESVAFLWGSRTAVKRDAENDRSHVRTGSCRLVSSNRGVRSRRGRFRRRGRLPRQLRQRLCGRTRLSLGCASRQDAPRLANTTNSGLQLISVSVERAAVPTRCGPLKP